ncbi:restriction endonuclease subunit S [Nitrosomonas sp. Is37]|uniref:restriction endonuclease subunit S n=1 Tax=Nitrosomonas sp. Is37 TaxID=3080535 RepID=UPI00294B2401|nr:restriction endonuclease subunit S [Nitrosomonas sp. Is37]MDV6343510.1 restriction endonuclease subunit S [Nitrosomonas sp. Is37]
MSHPFDYFTSLPNTEIETTPTWPLERYFDAAFAAPDGIKKLRELILTLAMQGKLVPQDPNDPPASELLKAIEAEKQRLVEEGKIKASKPLLAIKPEEMPYQLPKGWAWVRLGEIANYNGRKNVGSDEIPPNTWLLDLEDIEKDTSRVIYRAQYSERQSKSTKSTFKKGDVLYGKLRPYLNKVIVADNDGVCTTEIVPIFPYNGVDSKFLKWLLKCPSFLAYVNSLMYGVKMPRLGTEDAIMSIHLLPPFSEQHRLVAKIDQLMARCDELEKLRNEREQKRRVVHTTVVERLLDAASSFPSRRESSFSDASEFTDGLDSRLRGGDTQEYAGEEAFTDVWQFIIRHFSALYLVKENVTELRKAILQLAVMGKLVPKDPNDPPASELLKAIEAEKQRLVKEGKIKAIKPLSAIKTEEVPYQLPQGWEWVRLGELGITQTGTTPPSKESQNYGRYIPFIGPGDIKNGEIDYTGEGLSEIGLSRGRLIEKNSVLMVCIGGSIGKHAINDRNVTCNQQINTLTPYLPVPVTYIYWAMATISFQETAISQAGGSATPIINKQKWSSILIPLPPLPEQHRIVAKIDQLMALCDRLEQQIDAATDKQATLLNALMVQM